MKILFVIIAFGLTFNLYAETYYIDSEEGNDSNNGTSEGNAWQNVTIIKDKNLNAGDNVLLKRGQNWSGTLKIESDGAAGLPIIFGAFGSGAKPVIYGMNISADFIIVEDLVVDHNKDDSDCIVLSRAENVTLRNLEIKNGRRDAIDADKADNFLLDGCTIHHFLKGSFSNQEDAHGLVLTDTKGITVLNSEIYLISGDCIQTDPDRDLDTPDDLWIEGCHFWTGPLTEDFNSGWKAGDTPGENALDTKIVKDQVDWEAAERMKVTIKNTIAHGWQNGNISNMAAFNLKEKIDAVIDGVTVYDSEIAFRVRGVRGNANTTIMNAVVYDCEKAIRAEDDLKNLKVYNSTFGKGINTFLQLADVDGTESWEILNNAFAESKPGIASHTSNMAAADSDFEDRDNHNYRLTAGSALIDNGAELTIVKIDRDGNTRPQGLGYDAGAYEFSDATTVETSDISVKPKFYSLEQNYPNPFNPQTRIGYQLTKPGKVYLAVYASSGRLVKVLVNDDKASGMHLVQWDAKNELGNRVAGGMYHYRLIYAGKIESKKMLFIP